MGIDTAGQRNWLNLHQAINAPSYRYCELVAGTDCAELALELDYRALTPQNVTLVMIAMMEPGSQEPWEGELFLLREIRGTEARNRSFQARPRTTHSVGSHGIWDVGVVAIYEALGASPGRFRAVPLRRPVHGRDQQPECPALRKVFGAHACAGNGGPSTGAGGPKR